MSSANDKNNNCNEKPLNHDHEFEYELLDTTLFVFDFAEKGQLFDLLQFSQPLEEKASVMYLKQLVSGLECLHSHGVIHRDIKPSNLLLDSNFTLKIADLGLCKIFDPSNEVIIDTHSSAIQFKQFKQSTDINSSDSNSSKDLDDVKELQLELNQEQLEAETEDHDDEIAGTRGYIAPEIFLRQKYGPACDVFSAGVVLFNMLIGYEPFKSATSGDDIYKHINDGKMDEFWSCHPKSDTCLRLGAANLIGKMLKFNPNERISIESIKKDNWYKNTPHLTDIQLKKDLEYRYKQSIEKKKEKQSQLEANLMQSNCNSNNKFTYLDASEIASQWLQEKTYTIKNPLVVMLGIGIYDGLNNLIGIPKDYQNVIKIFHRKFGYDILYKLSNNKYNTDNVNVNVSSSSTSKQNSNNTSFKLKWDIDEIDSLVDKARTLILSQDKNYDSLIFIMSCHGESESVILDSDCEEYQLMSIFSKFNGSSMSDFAFCPKLFFVDACRGSMGSTPIKVTVKLNSKLNEFINSRKGSINSNTEKNKDNYTDNHNYKDKNKKENKNEDDNNDNNANNDSKNESIEVETKLNINIHKEANFFFVYPNPDGYAAFDAGREGGYLIQAICKVFQKKEILSKNLDDIIKQIGEKVRQLVGKQSMQHVQTVSNIHYRIKFRPME